MNKPLKYITSILCLLCFLISAPASAAGERIITSDVKVKTDRLFEVNIGFKSSRTITAARFTLTYNKNDIAARQPVCNFNRAQVRFIDKNGSTEIIFLCSDGIKCSDFSTLFSMKYKKTSDKNTAVKIKAYDCVDNNLKNFTPPSPAVCKVYADVNNASGGKSAGGSGRSGGSGGSDDDDFADSDIQEEDILETSGGSEISESDNPDIDGFSGDDDPLFLKLIPAVILFVVLIFLGLILYQNVQLKKAEKRREEEKDNNKE